MKRYIKKYKVECICLIIMITFSLLNIYKAPLLNIKYTNHLIKQIIWIIVGITLFILLYKIKFRYFIKFKYLLYILNILMLIFVLMFSRSTNGIKAWINIGPLSIQPSEFIKITFPLCVIEFIKNKRYFISFILFIIPSLLIILEPDTGNFILLLFIYIYLLTNKNNIKIIIFITISLLTIFISLLFVFKYYPNIIINIFNGSLYYRFKRITEYKNNYQINNALIGIGSSKLLPIKLKTLLIYIPEGITDFIFSFNICNYGIVSGLILLLTIFTFIYKLLIRSYKNLYYYKKKLLGTFLTIFIIQSLYNILMNLGLVPIMGIPLPFISYGGSNIITYLILYSFTVKTISYKDNNNYKNNYRKDLVDKKYNHMAE